MNSIPLSYVQICRLCSDYFFNRFRKISLTALNSGDLDQQDNLRIRIVLLPRGLFELRAPPARTPNFEDRLEICVFLVNGRCSETQLHVIRKLLIYLERNFPKQGSSLDRRQLFDSLASKDIQTLVSSIDYLEAQHESYTVKLPFSLSQPDWVQIKKARALLEISTKVSAGVPIKEPNCQKPETHKPTKETLEINMSNHDSSRSSGFFAAPPKLSPGRLAVLRKHVVNFNRGKFSSDGEFTSSKLTMQAIFDRHIPEWMASQRDKEHLDIVLYSHGGLTNEAWGLASADKQIDWWKSNGVYPIFFVWETGLMETLLQLFKAWWNDSPRGWFDDMKQALVDVNDGFWERAVRAGKGPNVWGGMKASARLAFDEASGGDGITFLESLVHFIYEREYEVKLHAVGHSAGSIFVSRAIAAANEIWEEYPKFETVHFLAPAITTDLFRQTLMPLIGRSESAQAKHLSVFTMSDGYERSYTVGPYRKSLLYLIYNALEPEKQTHLVGLEHSLNSEADMSDFFGLTGPSSQLTDVVYSVTPESGAKKKNRSESDTHGGFDDDSATMESVCRRIINSEVDDEINSFPESKSINATRLPRDLSVKSNTGYRTTGHPSHSHSSNVNQGNREALCIGIDSYDVNPLSGCENDAHRWSDFFTSLGFSTNLLLSANATRSNIVESITRLFQNASHGDVIAVQFAGHGTQVPDDDRRDEFGGDSPRKDEALVPIDYRSEGLLLDDDIGELCRHIPDGVNVTFFFDNCHSGTATRMFMKSKSSHGTARFLPLTTEMIEQNRAARNRRGMSRNSFTNPYEGKSEILFAACQSKEVAWESNGSGDFTRHAMRVFERHGSELSCEQFMNLVLQEFGGSRRQTPGLWCDPDLKSTILLGGVGRTAGKTNTDENPSLKGLVSDLRNVLNRYSG
ncbi:MAG: caspase family protein [Planctomycetota bacterium]